MNAAIVARTLSLIPDRVARVQSGSTFDATAPCCAHPDRIAHLVQFLNWLGPLNPVTKDDLPILGLLTPFGKPAIALDLTVSDGSLTSAGADRGLHRFAVAEPLERLREASDDLVFLPSDFEARLPLRVIHPFDAGSEAGARLL